MCFLNIKWRMLLGTITLIKIITDIYINEIYELRQHQKIILFWVVIVYYF